MSKKKKKSKAKLGGANVNVANIMRGIEEKARERALSEDVKKVSAIDLRKITLDESEDASLRNNFANAGKEEDVFENLTYINQNYSLTDRYNFVTTHRKGFVGKIVGGLLSKLFLAIKIFLDRIVVAQEIFNVKVVRLFNRISKDIERIDEAEKNFAEDIESRIDEKIDEKSAEFAEKTSDLAVKIDQKSAVLEEKNIKLAAEIEDQRATDANLAKRLEAQAKRSDVLESKIDAQRVTDADLAKRLEAEAKRGDAFAVQITSNREVFDKKIEDSAQQIKKELLYPNLDIDYKLFEDRFRGDQKAISDRQKQYLRFFHECKNVMDIGCGRGEFIELLHANGIGAFGVEIDSEMINVCRAKKLNVANVDAVAYLLEQFSRKEPDKIDGIFAAQVVEHLHMDYLIQLIKNAYKVLLPGKFIVLETINIKSLSTFTNSVYLDPTHVKPIHPETLKFLLESVGFQFEGFIFSSDFTDEEKLRKVEAKNMQDQIYNSNVNLLNELLFAPQDYAAIAQKI
ncbi:methyltransferase domain-containing protein [Candidatus Peregrinibacteria bacterium]|nr:methyltransferase domain-containing protein [Candidatus Peregrinibacteria bacterium]